MYSLMCVGIIKAAVLCSPPSLCQMCDICYISSHWHHVKQHEWCQLPPAYELTVTVSSRGRAVRPSIGRCHTYDRCDSFWFVHFICCVPSWGWWPVNWAIVLQSQRIQPPETWLESISKPYGLKVSNVYHSQLGWSWCVTQEEGVSLLAFGLSNIWPAVGFVCAGVEVRAAPGVQGQQNLKVTDAIQVKSSSSLKAHVSPLSSAFGMPGMDLDCRDKGMLCWEYGIPLHLCLLNQVSGSGSASSWALVEETEGPVLSVHLVFHRHTVASANALPPVYP